MLEFQEKRRLRKIIYSKVTLIVLIVFIGLTVNAVRGVYEKQRLAKENLKLIEANLENLKKREQTLIMEIDHLKTINGTEEEIRERYGLVKPGEEVIIVVDKDQDQTASTTADDKNLWQKIINWFK